MQAHSHGTMDSQCALDESGVEGVFGARFVLRYARAPPSFSLTSFILSTTFEGRFEKILFSRG